MYFQLSMADLAVKKPFYADGEVFSQNERSSPVCLQRSFLTGRLQSDTGDRSGAHRRSVLIKNTFLNPFRFLNNAKRKCI